uniref:Uncharacterized protein n=1 Tax=Theileria annulata TaxID=5874 RepID=A0A3B0N0I2_THEAN
MFQYTSEVNIEESLFTGIYVVISRTEGTSDALYDCTLKYLNSNYVVLNVKKLLSSYLLDNEFSLSEEKVYFSNKVRLGPTEILWEVDKKLSTPREELLNNAKSLSILKKQNILSQLTDDSVIEVRYLSEEKFSHTFVPSLFYSGNLLALLILNDDNSLTHSDLIDFFYKQKEIYGDKLKVKFQFFLSKSDDKVREELLDSFDKYVVKENLHKYRKVNNISDDLDLIYDSFFFITDNNTIEESKIYNIVSEVILNLMVTFLSQILTVLADENYSLENVRRPISHHSTHFSHITHSSNKHKSLPYSGVKVKSYGDINLLLRNDAMAIAYYTCANYYFVSEKNELFHAKTLFTVCISLSRLFNLVTNKYCWGSNSDNSSSKSSELQSNAKAKRDKNGAKSVYECVPKEMCEKPMEYLLYYLKKSFTIWLKTFDNSDEFQLLFVFYTRVLSEVNDPLLISVISSFITYSKRLLTLKQQLDIINYVVDLVDKTKYKRKLQFFLFLQDVIQCEIVKQNDTINGKLGDISVNELEIELNLLINNVVKYMNMNLEDNKLKIIPLFGKMNYYKNWYEINNAIINNELLRLKYEKSDKIIDKVKRVLSFKLYNILNCIQEYTVKTEINHLIKELKNYVTEFQINHLTISHIVVNTQRSNFVDMYYVRKLHGSKVFCSGGYEDIKLNSFPIVNSLELSKSDLNFRYTKENLKKITESSTNDLNFFIISVKRCKIRPNYTTKGFHVNKIIKSKIISHNNKSAIDRALVTNSSIKYVYEDLKDNLVTYTNKLLKIEMKITNPLPVDFVFKEVELVGSGVDFETIPSDFVVPAFSRNYAQTVNITVKEEGILCVLGVKFVLYDVLKCFQLLANLEDLDPNDFINTFKSSKMEDITSFVREYSMIKMNAVNDYNKCKIELFSTDFNDKMEYITSPSVISSTPNTILTPKSISSGRTISTNTNTSISTMSANSLLSTTNKGILGRSVEMCKEELCIDCSILDQLMSNLLKFVPNSDIIVGEKKLIYVKLSNKNRNHAFVNINVSILPHVDSKEKDSKLQALTAKDYIEFELLQQKLKKINQITYSSHVNLLCNHTIKQSLEHNSLVDEDRIVLLPGESLYLPVIYVANEAFSTFDVVFDYEIVESDENDVCYNLDLMRGSAFKSVEFSVETGIKVEDYQFVPIVYFNHRLFVDNIHLFKGYFSSVTVESLLNFDVEYDNKSVRAFFKVRNETDKVFSCNIKNRLEFISNPNTSNRWYVDLRKLRYKRVKQRGIGEFIKLFRHNIDWSCNSNKFGSIKLFQKSEPNIEYNFVSDNSLDKVDNKIEYGMKRKNKALKWYLMNMEKLINNNMNDLISSKLSLKLLVMVDDKVNTSDKSVNIEVGQYFTVCVLVKNNSNKPIDDYKVVIVPFSNDLYTNVQSLKWSGSLEQVGLKPINVSENYGNSTNTLKKINGDLRSVNVLDGLEGENWEGYNKYVKVGEVDFVAKQPCKLGINAAVILNHKRKILWHYKHYIINVM